MITKEEILGKVLGLETSIEKNDLADDIKVSEALQAMDEYALEYHKEKMREREEQKKPEGRKMVEDYVATHSDKYLMWNVSKSDLRKIENGGFEFIREVFWPTEFDGTGATHLFYFCRKYIYLRLKNTPA